MGHTKNKHSAEPWTTKPEPGYANSRALYAEGRYIGAMMSPEKDDKPSQTTKADAARVVACVNACEGMQQPEVAVAWARKAIDLMLKEWTRDQITEETLLALETAASALGKKS